MINDFHTMDVFIPSPAAAGGWGCPEGPSVARRSDTHPRDALGLPDLRLQAGEHPDGTSGVEQDLAARDAASVFGRDFRPACRSSQPNYR